MIGVVGNERNVRLLVQCAVRRNLRKWICRRRVWNKYAINIGNKFAQIPFANEDNIF